MVLRVHAHEFHFCETGRETRDWNTAWLWCVYLQIFADCPGWRVIAVLQEWADAFVRLACTSCVHVFVFICMCAQCFMSFISVEQAEELEAWDTGRWTERVLFVIAGRVEDVFAWMQRVIVLFLFVLVVHLTGTTHVGIVNNEIKCSHTGLLADNCILVPGLQPGTATQSNDWK